MRTVSISAVIAVVAAMTSAVGTASADTRTPAPGGRSVATSVTLVTGDQVILRDDRSAPIIQPAPGRERVGFSTRKHDGHLYVTPADATAPIGAGMVDRRLFDVTSLVESGYSKRSTLPLMVTAVPTQAGAQATATLSSVGLTAVSVPTADRGALAAGWTSMLASGGKVWLDGKRQANLDRSVPQIGAPAAWKSGYTGKGVKVAVLDTGVDQTHPDLTGRETAERNFTEAQDAVDRVGHGTHVASTIAGTGAKYRGVAHEAEVLDGKVLDDSGGGYDSWIIAGMEWAVEQGADVVNLSLGGFDGPEVDPLEDAVNKLSASSGVLFVVSAGNSGPNAGSVGSPGSADAALTVGAVDRDDSIADFSSRGPRTGDGAVKPDVTAPGVEIAAAKAAQGRIGRPVEPGYVALSGTSMAAPHVAGAAALLAQQHPDWTGGRIKGQLVASAKPTAGAGAFDQGSGRVDVAKALDHPLTAEPTSVSLGRQLWPHDDDKPVSATVELRNSSTSEVALDLTPQAIGPDGKQAPAGFFSLSPAKVTVPGGGTAKVTLTADTRLGSLDGAYSGVLLATGATASLRVPFAIDREVESYDLTANAIGPDGKPAGRFDLALFSADFTGFTTGKDGVARTRVPKGTYAQDTFLTVGDTSYHLATPVLDLTGARTITLDARDAKVVDMRTPESNAVLMVAEEGYFYQPVPNWGLWASAGSRVERGLWSKYYGSTPDLTSYALTYREGSESSSQLIEFGRKPFDGYERTYRPAEMGTVTTVTEGGGPPSSQLFGTNAPDGSIGLGLLSDTRPTPSSATFLTNTTQDVTRSAGTLFMANTEDFDIIGELNARDFTLRAGSTQEFRFNRPVIGHASQGPLGGREKDRLFVYASPFNDGLGNTGAAQWASGRMELFLDGKKVSESKYGDYGDFKGLPASGRYRLTSTVTALPAFPTSTRVDTAWTFRSDATDELSDVHIPVLRFDVDLGSDHTAPAGRPFTFPVRLQESGKDSKPHRLSVDVSYDEGKTWERAIVLGDSRVALHHPARGTVSLRAKASDHSGNEVETTIIKAYALGGH